MGRSISVYYNYSKGLEKLQAVCYNRGNRIYLNKKETYEYK